MRVLLLGAGASRAAGYPLASELMTVIERDALHGSVGWSAENDRHLAFDSNFLRILTDEVISDADEGLIPDGRPLITHPSYLKVLQNSFIRDIWERADDAIRSAENVDIWGYSLPESDIAARLLLAPLR